MDRQATEDLVTRHVPVFTRTCQHRHDQRGLFWPGTRWKRIVRI